MKTTVVLLMTFISLISYSQETSSITVTINNVPNDKGVVGYGLYSKDNFMVAAPVKAAESNITNGKTTVTFEDVPLGTYAILCYHDSNGNGKMDFETNGMPAEAYGGSNNVMAMGPPRWEDCKFELTEKPVELEIRF